MRYRLFRFLLLLCIIGSKPINGLTQDYAWLYDFGNLVTVKEINEAPNGNIIVSGEYEEFTFLDSTYIADLGGQNVFIASFSASGEEQWVRIVEGMADFEFFKEADVTLYAMDSDEAGNIYLLGDSRRPVRYQGATILDQGGHYLIKIDASGNLQRVVDDFFDTTLEDDLSGFIDLSDIAVSPTGELYVALTFRGTLDFNGTTYRARSRPLNRNRNDPLLIKYSTSGTVSWVVHGRSDWSESGGGNQKPQEIELDSDGNVLLAGTFLPETGTDMGLLFDGLPRLSNNQSGFGAFMVKISSNGVPQWSKLFVDDDALTTETEWEQMRDITTDGTDIILSVSFTDEVVIDGTIIQNPGPNRGDFPFDGNLIVRLDANGDLLWHKVFATENAFPQIAVDGSTNVVSVLATYEQLAFATENILLVDDRSDYFVADLDVNGGLINLDTTEYTSSNRDVIADKHPLIYMQNGTLLAGMRFDGGADVKIGDIIQPNPNSLIVARQPDLPFAVNLGPDRGQCQGTITLDAGVSNAQYLWSTGETSQTISVSVSGVYAVEVTNQDGDMATDTVQITIDEPVAFDLPDTVQGINQAILTIPADGLSYSWSTGDTTQSITVNASGRYWALATTAFGCESSDTVVVVLESLAIFKGGIGDGNDVAFSADSPTAFYSGGTGDGADEAFSFNDKAFYLGQAGDGYGFASEVSLLNGFYMGRMGDGHSTATSINESGGFYQGRIGDGYGNAVLIQVGGIFQGGSGDGYASDIAEALDEILSLLDDNFEADINVYPNPATDYLTVHIENSDGQSTLLTIYDALGNQMKQMTLASDNEKTISISHMRPGVYLLNFTRGKAQKTVKIIKH
ncbi:MAG: T9SS type A sorting domain-containing protein [Bacteroidota bacterium]